MRHGAVEVATRDPKEVATSDVKNAGCDVKKCYS